MAALKMQHLSQMGITNFDHQKVRPPGFGRKDDAMCQSPSLPISHFLVLHSPGTLTTLDCRPFCCPTAAHSLSSSGHHGGHQELRCVSGTECNGLWRQPCFILYLLLFMFVLFRLVFPGVVMEAIICPCSPFCVWHAVPVIPLSFGWKLST